jgi:hypothetical protein
MVWCSEEAQKYSGTFKEAIERFSLTQERVSILQAMLPYFCKIEVSKL